jgi:hypothetical protein
MRRAGESFNSLTSIMSFNSRSSINSRTKLYNTKDLQRYIANIEDDIIRNTNHCVKNDKKIDNIVNRYENRTNMLFMDLRHRETEHKRLYNTVACSNTIQITHSDLKDIDITYRYTLYALYIYTVFAVGMLFKLFNIQ